MRTLLLVAAVVWSLFATAAGVVKCVDAAGKITFTQTTCPVGAASELLEIKASQRPSGEGPAVRLADPSKTYIKRKPKPIGEVSPAPRPSGNTPAAKKTSAPKTPKTYVTMTPKL